MVFANEQVADTDRLPPTNVNAADHCTIIDLRKSAAPGSQCPTRLGLLPSCLPTVVLGQNSHGSWTERWGQVASPPTPLARTVTRTAHADSVCLPPSHHGIYHP
jgi:hypothetical protein